LQAFPLQSRLISYNGDNTLKSVKLSYCNNSNEKEHPQHAIIDPMV